MALFVAEKVLLILSKEPCAGQTLFGVKNSTTISMAPKIIIRIKPRGAPKAAEQPDPVSAAADSAAHSAVDGLAQDMQVPGWQPAGSANAARSFSALGVPICRGLESGEHEHPSVMNVPAYLSFVDRLSTIALPANTKASGQQRNAWFSR